jgi:hypothetical protein
MRGDERAQGVMFATVVLEDRIPADHPLRTIRRLVDPILRDLSPQFAALYSQTGRPSIPPEQLLRALLLQLLSSIRSERQLVEQLEYNLLFRWFCRPRPGGGGVARHRLHQEPAAPARRDDRGPVPGPDRRGG